MREVLIDEAAHLPPVIRRPLRAHRWSARNCDRPRDRPDALYRARAAGARRAHRSARQLVADVARSGRLAAEFDPPGRMRDQRARPRSGAPGPMSNKVPVAEARGLELVLAIPGSLGSRTRGRQPAAGRRYRLHRAAGNRCDAQSAQWSPPRRSGSAFRRQWVLRAIMQVESFGDVRALSPKGPWT